METSATVRRVVHDHFHNREQCLSMLVMRGETKTGRSTVDALGKNVVHEAHRQIIGMGVAPMRISQSHFSRESSGS